MSQQEEPKQVTMNAEQAQSLKARIEESNLNTADQRLVVGLIHFNLWLQDRLKQAKLSIKRLKRLFGITTEKKRLKKKMTILW